MCTCTPSGGRVHLFFLRRQKYNVHTWHHSKITEDTRNKKQPCYRQSKDFSTANDNK